MIPEKIYYLFEVGIKDKQEDYIWPVAGKATVNDNVFIVCDGGGRFHNGGIASKLICRFMAAKVSRVGEQKMSGELINKLLVEARGRLIAHARENRMDTDLATTFSMIILYNQRVLMSWYGDSRIYHLRGGEILFKTEDNSLVGEPRRNTVVSGGIKADGAPINAETKWIVDIRDGDYILLCSKGITENVTDEDIKYMTGQNDKAAIDLTGSFRRLAFEKTPDNYSMYLIKVISGIQKRSISNGIITIREQTRRMAKPVFVIATTVAVLFIMLFYFRKARNSDFATKYRNQTTQPAHVIREDSVPSAIVMSAPRYRPSNVRRSDSVSGAIVRPETRKPIPAVTDSVKNNNENPPATLQIEKSAAIQDEERPAQIKQTLPADSRKRVAQLKIKITTDKSCRLKITNLDLDEVFDWDLSPNDNGTLYLKPGRNSILATEAIDSSKTKTYHFDVKTGYIPSSQNLHIKF